MTNAAAVTTSKGLRRAMKPTTTMTIPTSDSTGWAPLLADANSSERRSSRNQAEIDLSATYPQCRRFNGSNPVLARIQMTRRQDFAEGLIRVSLTKSAPLDRR